MQLKITLGALLLAVPFVWAAPRLADQVTKVFQQDGDRRLPLAVTCAHDSWTELLPARAVRRRAVLHALNSSVGNVCLSTITTIGYACTDTTPGVELSSGTFYSEYSEAVLNCRSRASTSEKIKGMEFYDVGD